MNNFQNSVIKSITAIGFLFLYSCEKHDIEDKSNHNITAEMAIDIAHRFNPMGPIAGRMERSDRTVESTSTITTAEGANAIHVINYNEGGFLVLAGDDRMSPIRAYAETGSFSTTEMPDVIVAWIENEQEYVQHVRENVSTQSLEVQLEWDQLLAQLPPPLPNLCEDTFYQKGPLLTTRWGQWHSYNNLIPLNCPNSSGKAPTGCVATAMAQVLRYYQKPNTYNWGNMPPEIGTMDTQELMVDAANSVNTIFDCETSSANVSVAVVNALKRTSVNPVGFSYSNAQYTESFTTDLIRQQISLNRPVIMRGERTSNSVGHAWVCDGYRYIMTWQRDSNGFCINGAGAVFYHMNWGWDNLHNGWYNSNNFNPDGETYNYKRGVVYNITP